MPLLTCPTCGFYTLGPQCPRDGARTIAPGPAKYSPEDHYGRYRRALKKEARARAAASPARGAPAPSGDGAAAKAPPRA